MSTPHKYAKEIIYWANGGEIQWGFKLADGDGECYEWHDYRIWDKFTDFNNPQIIFRIKPETLRHLWYLVGLMKNKGGKPRLRVVTGNDQERFIQAATSYGVFIEWLTDRIEIEV